MALDPNIQAFQELNRLLIENIKQNPDTAKIRASGRFEAFLDNDASTVYLEDQFIKYTVPYAPFIDSGRGKGGVPKGFADIIYQWSKDKGIKFDRESKRKSFAYLTAKKIAREGSRKFNNKADRTTIIDSAIKASIPKFLKTLSISKIEQYNSQVQEIINEINNRK